MPTIKDRTIILGKIGYFGTKVTIRTKSLDTKGYAKLFSNKNDNFLIKMTEEIESVSIPELCTNDSEIMELALGINIGNFISVIDEEVASTMVMTREEFDLIIKLLKMYFMGKTEDRLKGMIIGTTGPAKANLNDGSTLTIPREDILNQKHILKHLNLIVDDALYHDSITPFIEVEHSLFDYSKIKSLSIK